MAHVDRGYYEALTEEKKVKMVYSDEWLIWQECDLNEGQQQLEKVQSQNSSEGQTKVDWLLKGKELYKMHGCWHMTDLNLNSDSSLPRCMVLNPLLNTLSHYLFCTNLYHIPSLVSCKLIVFNYQ